MAIICCCAHALVHNMGIPYCCEIVIVLHGFPMFCAFCRLFIIFTWDAHINGHKTRPFRVEKPYELRNVTRSTWGFHVGKACCKILQYWRRIPCKCALCGVSAHGIFYVDPKGGGFGPRDMVYMEFLCRELTTHGILYIEFLCPGTLTSIFTWRSYVGNSNLHGITWNSYVLADLRASLHGIPMWGAETFL